jgi:hypothetical protein
MRGRAMMGTLIVGALLLTGCSGRFWGGAATGGAVAGGAYEYQNKRAIEGLEEDLEEGRISRGEYERRREEIEDRSLVY